MPPYAAVTTQFSARDVILDHVSLGSVGSSGVNPLTMWRDDSTSLVCVPRLWPSAEHSFTAQQIAAEWMGRGKHTHTNVITREKVHLSGRGMTQRARVLAVQAWVVEFDSQNPCEKLSVYTCVWRWGWEDRRNARVCWLPA